MNRTKNAKLIQRMIRPQKRKLSAVPLQVISLIPRCRKGSSYDNLKQRKPASRSHDNVQSDHIFGVRSGGRSVEPTKQLILRYSERRNRPLGRLVRKGLGQ
jgi:hypothetical protein